MTRWLIRVLLWLLEGRPPFPIMARHRDEWFFVDVYGVIYRLRQTHEQNHPLLITKEVDR
jgi:hypothetical protein